MKITKQQLKQIIKEELLKEAHDPVGPGPSSAALKSAARRNFPPDVLAQAGYGKDEPVVQPGMKSGMDPVMRVLESIMEQISATYNSLSHPHDQEDFEKYLNENVRLMTEAWQEDREIEADLQRAPGER